MTSNESDKSHSYVRYAVFGGLIFGIFGYFYYQSKPTNFDKHDQSSNSNRKPSTSSEDQMHDMNILLNIISNILKQPFDASNHIFKINTLCKRFKNCDAMQLLLDAGFTKSKDGKHIFFDTCKTKQIETLKATIHQKLNEIISDKNDIMIQNMSSHKQEIRRFEKTTNNSAIKSQRLSDYDKTNIENYNSTDLLNGYNHDNNIENNALNIKNQHYFHSFDCAMKTLRKEKQNIIQNEKKTNEDNMNSIIHRVDKMISTKRRNMAKVTTITRLNTYNKYIHTPHMKQTQHEYNYATPYFYWSYYHNNYLQKYASQPELKNKIQAIQPDIDTHKMTIINATNELITAKQKKVFHKKKKKKLKSIGKRHPEFELTYDMMLGIRYAVSLSEPSVTTTHAITNSTHTITSTHTQDHVAIYNTYSCASSTTHTLPSNNYSSSDDSDDELQSSELEYEFLETKKYKFPSRGSYTTPAHQMSDFKFKDYCPQIFRQLREWFTISTEEYLITICGDFKLLEFISNSKSGQFFFFSHNSQFIIKTMTRTESIFLRKILPSYYTYVSQQPDTLLPKFYGMHRVERKKQKIYFLIQQNVFYSDVDNIHDQYDLKGSTQGRRATKAERKKGAILKDLDWLDECKKINIGPIRARLFRDQLKRDTHWLRGEKIMDYSLLVGIHYLDRVNYVTAQNIATDDVVCTNAKVVLDHSCNDIDNYNKFEPELQSVNEDKETCYTCIQNNEQIEETDENMRSQFRHGQLVDDIDELQIKGGNNGNTKSIQNKRNTHSKSQSEQNLNSILHDHDVKLSDVRNNAMYRGHISVKHPKRYKRKTAAQMQFAVEDIHIPIPKGIKHEMKEEKEEKEKNDLHSVNIENNNNINEPNELNDNINANSAYMCPWTTYHGGMIYEDIENNYMGNEVYFVGLIDILQKYNKRKKLENWIKKMKYDKRTISAAPPDLYAQRMCDFFEDKVV